MFDSKMYVDLISTNASDDMVCMAAWVSTGSDNESRLQDKTKVEGLINYLYKNKHMSPFEHGQFIFRILCPIFVAREFFRHRTFSFNERSARYSILENRFYIPSVERPLIQTGKIGHYIFEPGDCVQNELTLLNLKSAYNCAWSSYERMLAAGIAKEVARDCLPLGIYTEFYATVNPRNLMHFLDLRLDDTALYEIREVANQMEQHFKQTMPLTWKAWDGA